MTTKKVLSPKLKEGKKILSERNLLGKIKTSTELIAKLEKLGYQWDTENQIWVDTNKQTTIYIKTDNTIAHELIESIIELFNNFEYASFELKNRPIINDALDKDKKVIEGMKKCFLVYNNLDLEEEITDESEEDLLDVDDEEI